MASGAILVNQRNRILRYPGGSIVVHEDFNPSPYFGEDYTAFAVSHDEGLFSFISGTEEAHSVYITPLPTGGTSEEILSNSEVGGGFIWDQAMSPRGDVLAIAVERDGGWIYIYQASSTLYENPTGGLYTRLDNPASGFAQLPRFTPDGDGLLFDFVDFATRTCQLWHAGFRATEQGPIATTISPIEGTTCEIPGTASQPEIVSGGSAKPFGAGR